MLTESAIWRGQEINAPEIATEKQTKEAYGVLL